MGIPQDSAYSALESTNIMQNFDIRKCPNTVRNNKSLIICKEDGCLCYDNEDCPYKKECKVNHYDMERRANAFNYHSFLKQTPEENAHRGKSLGTLINENPEFLVKQLIRKGTFGEFNSHLKFLSLEIVNAFYSNYLQKVDRAIKGE